MSQTKNPCEPLIVVWLRPSTAEPCICCKQVAEKPRGGAPENVCMYVYLHMTCGILKLSCKFEFVFEWLKRS